MSEISRDEFMLDKDCWDIIDSYFRTVSNYISKNQIDSFNMCLDEQIGKSLRQFNPIQSVYDYPEGKSPEGKFEVDVYIGGSRLGDEVINDGKGISIGKPIIFEKKIITDQNGLETEVINKKQLYPNEARLKNLTYTVAIYTDIYVVYRYYDNQNRLKLTKISNFEKKLLGRMPCMLQSKGCVLSAIPRANLKEFGECPYDHGGYFIIDGKEKVITAQTRQIENKIYVKKNKPDEPNEYEAEIRSVPENTHQPARITRIYIKTPVTKIESIRGPKEAKETKVLAIPVNKSGIIMVAIPNITESIPIFVLFRALGITSDKEILQYICGDIERDNKGEKSMAEIWADYLYDNVYLAAQVKTQLDAFRYIQNIINSLNPNKQQKKDPYKDDSLDDKDRRIQYYKDLEVNEKVDFKYIMDILYNWFIPHMGTNNLIEKAAFLGYMTRELLKTKWEMIETTDRDNYMYKRIDVGGFLMSSMFRDLYFRVRNNFEHSMNTNYSELTKKQALEVDLDGRLGRTNIDELLVNQENIDMFISQDIVTDGFKYAFKNCWGLRNAPCKEGVVQDLARLTYLGMISHIRRVVTPLGTSSKLRGPHMLHLSTYGILCPIETPDGGNVGVKTNIALLTDITFGTNSSGVYHALLDNHLILPNQLPIQSLVKIDDLVSVFLNGRLVGYHKHPHLVVKRLRLLRRNARINIYTSIAWYIDRMEIKISTDSGRSCHPMLIVSNNKIKLNMNHLTDIRSNTKTWYDLITERIGWDQYDPRYYSTSERDDELERTAGVIEYIDTEELNTCLVAMNNSMLVNNPDSKFTHCEIHPSVIFGIMGNIIPFVQTNQLPRNIYSCGQGKQAIGVYASNYLNRMDTKTQVLYYPQKSLIQNRISKHLYNNTLPYGFNAIIGIACYSGYNQDDSIIFNRSSLERGLFRTIKYRTYSIREELNEYTNLRSRICNPMHINEPGVVVQNIKPGNYSKLDLSGIIREGEKADENDIVCGKVIMTNNYDENGKRIYLDVSEYIRRAETGTVDKTFFSFDNNGYKFVKVRLRKEKIPELGDKFASRSGQKGIMGMILNEIDMPISAKGIRPDMIINPQAFPKRMTISQFVESYFAKECCLLGIFGDSSPFQTIPIEKIGEVLERQGYERYGCELLYNGCSGEQLEADIFIGPTYYERLQHQVEDKMHSRAEGAVTMLSKQPTGGRSIGGGLRIGEMERDSLLAHGISAFLKETMSDRSDSTDIIICSGCGQIALANQQKNIYHCYNCNSSRVYYKKNKMHKEQTETSKNNFELLQIPYAMKLLTQELEGMSIQPHFITDNSSKQWKPITKWASVPTTKKEPLKIMNEGDKTKSYYTKQGNPLDKPFREYQNIIKQTLINGASAFAKLNSAIDRPKLIDFSAGRGGDIPKWIGGNYEYVLALDLDENGLFHSADCLITRIETYKKNFPTWFQAPSQIEVGVSNSCEKLFNGDSYKDTNPNNIKRLKNIIEQLGPNSFDVASLQFSAHYCFDSMLHINNLLQNIRDSLKEKGIAIITTFDGKRVYDLLKKTPGDISFSVNGTNLYSISFRDEYPWQQLPSDQTGINVAINVKLAATDQSFTEYLVHPELLLTQAKFAGLRPATIAEVSNHFSHLTYPVNSMTNPAAHFVSTSEYVKDLLQNPKLNELKEFAGLYNYYIFVKETPYESAFEDITKCTRYLSPQISTISHDQLSYYRKLYPIHTHNKIVPTEYKILYSNETQNRIHDNITMRVPTISYDTFYEVLQNSTNQVDDIIYISIKNGQIVFYAPVFNSQNGLENVQFPDLSSLHDYYMRKFQVYPELQLDPLVSDEKQFRKDGCLLKNTKSKMKWSDMYYGEIYHMFNTLCKERTILDVELLINKGNQKIKHYENSFPILQFFESTKTLKPELAIPTPLDWWFISKLFFKSSSNEAKGCINGYLAEQNLHSIKLNWQDKIDKAVFRGSAQGCGVIPSENNLRLLFASKIKQIRRADIDAAFTGIDRSDIFIDDTTVDFLKKVEILELLEVSDQQALADLSKYKFIFSVQAYNTSLKLGYLLSLGSLVIKYEPTEDTNQLWFEKFLKAFNPIHPGDENSENCDYITISSSDDIDTVMNWCQSNKDICAKIAENGKQNINRLLAKDAVFDYLQSTINIMISVMSESTNDEQNDLGSIESELYGELSQIHSGSIDVEKRIANLIKTNKEIIRGYYNLETLEVLDDVIINYQDNQYYNIRFSGTQEFNNAKQFLESISDWITGNITNLNAAILQTILRRQKEIERVFSVYLFIQNDEIIAFGAQTNVDNCIDYIMNSVSVNDLDILPWHPQKSVLLKINKEDLDIGVRLHNLAVVFPTTMIHNDINNEIISENVHKLTELFKKYNIRPYFMELHQQEQTTLQIPADIDILINKSGSPILKPNIIGLFAIAGRIVPPEFKKILVFAPGVKLELEAELERRFVSCLSGFDPVVSLGKMWLFNNRDTLSKLQPYFFGASTDILPIIINSIKIDSIIQSNKFNIVYELPNDMNKRNFILQNLPSADFFRVVKSEMKTSYHYNEVDFMQGALPLVIDSEQLTVPDGKNSIKWIANYLERYLDPASINTTVRTVEISRGPNDNFIRRLILAIDQILVKSYSILVTLNILDAPDKIIVTIKNGSVREYETIDQLLPYYTINHSYYMHDITITDIKETSSKIQTLKESEPMDKTLKIPTIPKCVQITRIGNYILYFNGETDNVDIYDLILQEIVEDKPDLFVDIDINLLLIMYKDKNDHLLKLIFSDKKFSEFQTLPELRSYTAIRGVVHSQINKTVIKTLIGLEPALPDIDRSIGYND
jgi:DNA-directed RNA polymerase II subunit RPB2